jgi:hypothetical protein
VQSGQWVASGGLELAADPDVVGKGRECERHGGRDDECAGWLP